MIPVINEKILGDLEALGEALQRNCREMGDFGLILNAVVRDLSEAKAAGQTEIISMDEFCIRMGIGRTKAFELKKKGIFAEGRHYMRIGRSIRFVWGPELLARLQADCIGADKMQEKAVSRILPKNTPLDKASVKRQKGKTVINLDYCGND